MFRNTMFSLRSPIPFQNTLTPPPNTNIPLFSHSHSHRYSYPRSQTYGLISQPVTVAKLFTTTASAPNLEVRNDRTEVELIPADLQAELIPKHVAVIMDGNRRWAKMRGLEPWEGYEAGVRSLRTIVRLCCNWGIKVLTVFWISTDNWTRPKVEVDFLLNLLESFINSELEAFKREGVKISMIGDSTKLPKSLQRTITSAEESTKDNSRFQLILGVNYGGKHDVIQACKSVAKKVKDDILNLEDINENIIEQELETNCTEFPCPDLLIRTSGELRVSNFLLWQLAYTELYFSQELWPDFAKDEFIEALISFQQRQRRFGGQHS